MTITTKSTKSKTKFIGWYFGDNSEECVQLSYSQSLNNSSHNIKRKRDDTIYGLADISLYLTNLFTKKCFEYYKDIIKRYESSRKYINY